MQIVNVEQVQNDLSRYLDDVARGEEVVIARAGKPLARLIPYHAAAAPREPGYWRGQVHIAADFDALAPELAAPFRGDAP